jgi:antitoxin MazE
MSQRVVLGKWGANVAVRLPRDIVQKAGFTSGTSVEVEARNGELVIRSVQPRYTLDEFILGVTPEAVREAFQWGDDIGREAVE